MEVHMPDQLVKLALWLQEQPAGFWWASYAISSYVVWFLLLPKTTKFTIENDTDGALVTCLILGTLLAPIGVLVGSFVWRGYSGLKKKP